MASIHGSGEFWWRDTANRGLCVPSRSDIHPLTGGRALLASAFSRTSEDGAYGGGANANAGASVVEVATGEPMHGASVISMVR